MFSLTWEAKSNETLIKTIAKSVSITALNGALSYASGPVGKMGLLMLGLEGVLELRSVQKLFSETRSKAKIAGRLLACSLALR